MAENVEDSKMFFYDDDSESPKKCRDRRRRRIELRKCAFSAMPLAEGNGIQPAAAMELAPKMELEPSSGKGCVEEAPPEFGFMSLAGRRRDMEDAVSVQISLCWPEICRRQPVHFFAVFDGHGGAQVATMCKERMHAILKEELERVKSTRGWIITGSEVAVAGNQQANKEEGSGEEEVVGWWKAVLTRTFKRMDEAVLSCCSACGKSGFAIAGSTAVVAVVTPSHILVANCGDSRAVLCRGGQALPLSSDHKPDRPDELARIEAAGGRVINVKGARVQGILAMSRSIGDKFLKRFVTSEPEISITKRNKEEDECLILASDGVWDVISSELACEIAHSCLKEERNLEGEGTTGNQSMLVATLLTRLALGRDSCDNLSTIVVHLKNTLNFWKVLKSIDNKDDFMKDGLAKVLIYS
ncbi:hypothetical protein V2J09_014521 [Rumex salicifolius]